MKKILTISLTLVSLISLTGCNSATQSEADKLRQQAESTYNEASQQAQDLTNKAVEIKDQTEEKFQQVQDTADAVNKLTE